MTVNEACETVTPVDGAGVTVVKIRDPEGDIETVPLATFELIIPKFMSEILVRVRGLIIFAVAVTSVTCADDCPNDTAENERITIAERRSFFMIFVFLMG